MTKEKGKMKNPFAVLGLNPSTFSTLSDVQVAGLVKVQFRALSKVFHPDSGELPNAKKFREIAEAAQALLDEPDVLEYWRLAMKSKKPQYLEKQALQHQRVVHEIMEQLNGTRSAVMQYFRRIGDSSLQDSFRALVKCVHKPALLFATRSHVTLSDEKSRESNTKVFELVFENRKVTKRMLKKVFIRHEKPDKSVPKEFIHIQRFKQNSYFWKLTGAVEVLKDVGFVGCLGDSSSDDRIIKKIFGPVAELVSPKDIKEKMQDGYSIPELTHVLHRLSTDIERQSMLLFADRHSRIHIPGQVVQIL